MKRLTILLLSTCLLVWGCKKTNTTQTNEGNGAKKYSATDFTVSEIEEYSSLQYTMLLDRIYKSVENSSLTAYKDEACKEKYSAEDFEKIHSAMAMVQMANPESPQDPFDLIDTLVFTHISAEQLKGCWLDKTNNVFAFVVNNSAKAYFTWEGIEKAITQEQVAFVNAFFKAEKNPLPLSAIKNLATDKFKTVAQKLYTWAIQDDSMAVYESHDLSQSLTRTEVSTKAKNVDVVQMPNPNNMDDATDVVDSITITPFSAASITKARIYYTWQTDNNLNTTVSTFAFAPLHNPVVSGYKLPLTPLFFAKTTDVFAKLSSEDKIWLTYFSIALTRNKGSQNTGYGTGSFKSAEYWE
mgnify:CR=1 FL=1